MMYSQQTPHNMNDPAISSPHSADQRLWNAVLTAIFVFLFFVLASIVWSVRGALPKELPPFDFVLLCLATFRAIRLVAYDKIFLFVRDYFEKSERGFKRAVFNLLQCPWCVGIWAALGLTFGYFVFPVAWYFILLLALAGVGSFIQILINQIGWRAEQIMNDVEGREPSISSTPAGKSGVRVVGPRC